MKRPLVLLPLILLTALLLFAGFEHARQAPYRCLATHGILLEEWSGGLNGWRGLHDHWFLAYPAQATITTAADDPARVLASLRRCRSIQTLNIKGTPDKFVLSGISATPHIRSIAVEGAQSDDQLATLLGPHVEEVILTLTPLSAPLVAHLSRMPALRSLKLVYCSCPEDHLAPLAASRSLTSLAFVTSEVFPSINQAALSRTFPPHVTISVLKR